MLSRRGWKKQAKSQAAGTSDNSGIIKGTFNQSILSRLLNSLQRKKNIRKAIGIKKLTIILGLLIVVAIAVLMLVVNKQGGNKVSGPVVCSGRSPDVLKEASGLLVPEKSSELKPIAEKIRTLPEYDKDPDCLGVLVTYYTNITDPKTAREILDKLNAIYNPEKGFTSSYKASGGKGIEELRTGVEFVEKLDQEFKNNMFYGPEV